MDGYINGKIDKAWWETQVKAGEEFRKKAAFQAYWKRWRKYYRGEWDPTKRMMPSAIFFRMVRTIVPRVYFRNPSVSVISRRPGLVNWAFAQLLERTDNKMIRQMKLKKHMKKIVHNTFLYGTGVGKLGFGAQFTPTPDETGEAPTDKKGYKFEYSANVFPNMPWFMSTHPKNFVVPAGLEDMDESPWVAEFIRRPLDDLKRDPRFTTKDINPSQVMTSTLIGLDNQQLKFRRPVPMVDMYEVRDKRTGQVFVVTFNAGGQNGVLLEPEEDVLQFENRINYYPSVFNDDDEFFWGIPDSIHLEPHQLEMNEIRTMITMHRRLALRKILYKQNAITPSELDKLLSDDPYAAVQIQGEPLTDIRFADVGDIPEGLLKAEQEVMQQLREDIGFSRNEFGDVSPPNARTTKFESRVAKVAAEIRVDERRDMMADMLVEVIKDMHNIIFNHWGVEQVLDVVGPAGVPLWVRFQPEMLRMGQYEVSIDPDSAIPQTREVREAKALGVYERLKMNPLIDPLRLTRYFLHEMHGVQFDDMIRGLPPNAGSQQQPLSIEQFVALNQQVANRVPAALPAPGTQAA